MTTKPTTTRAFLPLPDPPEREPEDMTSFDHLTPSGSVHHLGKPETTIVAGERHITREPGAPAVDRMAPDLLIAFQADPQAYREDNGYVISVQGKPPDFVMEIAYRSTGRQDVEEKRTGYAGLEIPEYWRFDETGEFHGTRLAGDRLVQGRYEAITIETVEDGILQGHSYVLNLDIRWEHGELAWHDPETGRHIATFATERQARLEAQARGPGTGGGTGPEAQGRPGVRLTQTRAVTLPQSETDAKDPLQTMKLMASPEIWGAARSESPAAPPSGLIRPSRQSEQANAMKNSNPDLSAGRVPAASTPDTGAPARRWSESSDARKGVKNSPGPEEDPPGPGEHGTAGLLALQPPAPGLADAPPGILPVLLPQKLLRGLHHELGVEPHRRGVA